MRARKESDYWFCNLEVRKMSSRTPKILQAITKDQSQRRKGSRKATPNALCDVISLSRDEHYHGRIPNQLEIEFQVIIWSTARR